LFELDGVLPSVRLPPTVREPVTPLSTSISLLASTIEIEEQVTIEFTFISIYPPPLIVIVPKVPEDG
jgi:hypothetical protein